MVLITMDERFIIQLLSKCWSPESSSLYTEEHPAKGQCSVTALVIPIIDQMHFSNV
ncbi:YunG family protein [Chroococcidiopsis sp.]|uniref:YunG family protein n=1 Tax=Chroococcidiopsis sp. TaxID=3088168 RepID=UPI003F3FFB72